VSEISSIDIGDLPQGGGDEYNFVIEQDSIGGNFLRRDVSDGEDRVAELRQDTNESIHSFGAFGEETLGGGDGLQKISPDPMRSNAQEMQNPSNLGDEDGDSDAEPDALSMVASIGPSVGPGVPKSKITSGSRKATYADLQNLLRQSKLRDKKKGNWQAAIFKARSFKKAGAGAMPFGSPGAKEHESLTTSPVKKASGNTLFSVSKNLKNLHRERNKSFEADQEVASLREEMRTLVQMQASLQQQLALLIQMNSQGNSSVDSRKNANAGVSSFSFYDKKEKKGAGAGKPSEGGGMSMLSSLLHPGHSRVHTSSDHSLHAITELSLPNIPSAGRSGAHDENEPATFDENAQSM
jgi:hypothetical protein